MDRRWDMQHKIKNVQCSISHARLRWYIRFMLI